MEVRDPVPFPAGGACRSRLGCRACGLLGGRFHKLIYALHQTICALHPTFEEPHWRKSSVQGANDRRRAQNSL